MSLIDRQFLSAVNLIRSLPMFGIVDVPVNKKLKFYSLFKVATEGKNFHPKPKLWEIIERQKWKAWKDVEEMDQITAKKLYVREFGEILKEIYLGGNSEYYLSNADLSFMKKISRQDLDILFNAVLADEETEDDVKNALSRVYKDYSFILED